jgi:radical SAM superfamily enzyme YgiQ (UPF0313 family)
MSNLAVHLLYRHLNSRDEVVCERVFFDGDEDPVSLESARHLSSFEIVFFTLPFEMDYPNIPRMLAAGSIALTAIERGADAPLVVAGGICVMANPEPLSAFFDLFLMGDVETCLNPFMERYLQVRGGKRAGLIEDLSAWKWVYNPARLDVSYKEDGTVGAFVPPSFRVEIERYRGKKLASSAIVTSETEFGNMLLVEGSRGCPSACAFCLAGNIYPFVSDRLEQIDDGAADVGIIGGGVSFHPRLAEIIRRFKEAGVNVHLPSLKLDEVPLEVIDLLKDSIKTLTFGIEAGTEDLRRRIGKPLGDKAVFDRIEAMADLKSFNFKFYFMVGLPGEQRKDLEAIVELIKHILHLLVKKGSTKGRIGSITVHASPFVPKAATPFQWLAMDDMKELKEKMALLGRGLGKVANTHFTHESIKYSFLQGVFARGDRRLRDVILGLSKGMSLRTIKRESPINLDFYAARERGEEETFPWDFIGGRAEKQLLRKRLVACLS